LQFGGQTAVLERQRDLDFECTDYIFETLQIVPVDGCHLFQFHVAGHVLLSQVLDEAGHIDAARGVQPEAGVRELVRKAMDFPAVQASGRGRGQIGAADGSPPG
jgi:hypothetical protein